MQEMEVDSWAGTARSITVHAAQTVTDFADASHSESAKSAVITVSYGIFVTVQPCAGLNEKVCCKLACISTFSSKSAYGGTTKLLVFMNMKTRRCNG